MIVMQLPLIEIVMQLPLIERDERDGSSVKRGCFGWGGAFGEGGLEGRGGG